MGLVLRNAVLEDVGKMSFVHASTWKETYRGIFPEIFLENLKEDFWIKRFENMIENKRGCAFVAELDGEIIGDIIFGKSRDEKFPKDGEIYAINILPEFQKKGIGKKLIKIAIDELKSKYESVFLKVVAENTNARKFYEKAGFKDVGIIFKDKIDDFYFNEVIYRCETNKLSYYERNKYECCKKNYRNLL